MKDGLTTLLHRLLPKHALTHLAGKLADSRHPAVKDRLIAYFMARFQIDLEEALETNPKAYATFNDFFIRQLKASARPIADKPIVSPVDGVLSETHEIHEGRLIQAKQRFYTVQDLLMSDASKANYFEGGRFMTFYLAPHNYHRVHMPLEGHLTHMHYLPGRLFSVQPVTVRGVPNLFARNERLVLFFDTDIGQVAMVLVGATIVGAIGTSWTGDLKRTKDIQQFDYHAHPHHFLKAQDLAYFKLGSTVVLLVPANAKLRWQLPQGFAPKVQMGQALADF
ncbi:MAG: phosphatidylserine decarboxylase [Legionellaceae bacterium]|nr:phosphatidylserine decarboxylase [Legionellaceae bacterium]MBJ16501.1 phosphatidylserine decarboxylase [Legionellaceae bacterium]HCA89898.1 phosphatidylserine decarboxylase [Legionellales bacterium]|tara:strand:+ start:609 stop:1448 length:840 start_codon:yes stop_codon:yes gene_type:complete